MKKVLLVTLQPDTDAIGLKYIHSFLRKNEIDSHMLFIPDYSEKHDFAVEKFVGRFKPDIIGVSLMSAEFGRAKKFTAMIKQKYRDTTVVWGGIHPSIAPVQCLEYADFVFVGESESAFAEFINAAGTNKPVLNIPNLAYKADNAVVTNRVRPYLDNLDILPFPEHRPSDSFILHGNKISEIDARIFRKYARYSGKFYSLVTTRGCPFSCSYCCNSFYTELYQSAVVRQRSVDNVIDELKLAIKLFPDIVYINIQDDNFFNYDLSWMEEFARKYKKEKIGKKFVCRTTPKHVNDDKIAALKEIGLSWIFMGLQSGSQKINKEIYKRFVPNESFLSAARVVKNHRIAGFYDVILDNPYESEEDVLATIDVLLNIPKPFMLQIFSLCFYEGTKLHKKALGDKVIFEDPRLKKYTKYKNTYLNKVIRLAPLLPGAAIRSLIKNRNNKMGPFAMNIVYYPALLAIEPAVWLRLIFISLDCSVFATINMLSSFFYSGIEKIVLRK